MRPKQKGRGFDPHSGRRVVSLSKIGLGSTHFMILIRLNKGLSTHLGTGISGGGVTCTKVTCMDPEFFRGGGGREGAPPDLCESIIGGSSLRPGVFLEKSDEFSSYCFRT